MIYLGMSPWEGMWKSRHQLMSRFSSQMPVLYVEPWITLRSLRTGKADFGVGLKKIREGNAKQFAPNVTVLGGSVFRPVSHSSLVGSVTKKLWLNSVHRAARSARITKPILWVCRPEMGFAVGHLGECLSIYHVVDEYSGYTGLDQDAMTRIKMDESDVLDRVGLTIAASPQLVLAKSGSGRDTVLLENGVEPTEYSAARQADEEPSDIETIPHPRIGYCGLIGKRLNLDLLTELARSRPDWSIVMIGKLDSRECSDQIDELFELENVHFLGEKSPTAVAQYICSLDIGLLPYAINRETQHISPIKMYEYWAAGIQVVATEIPAAVKHDFAVNVAKSDTDFIDKIGKSLSGVGMLHSQELVELAEENSWQNRVDHISDVLMARLGPELYTAESASCIKPKASVDATTDTPTLD